jgi:hypothetical protein
MGFGLPEKEELLFRGSLSGVNLQPSTVLSLIQKLWGHSRKLGQDSNC